MSVINTVFKVSEMFTKNPEFVSINYENLEKVANKMLEEGKIDFFSKESKENYQDLNYTNEIKLELLASSINYCYWYGKPDIRPANSSSTLMYGLLVDNYNKNNRQIDMKMINNFVADMAEARFPLIEERARHLVQTASRWEGFVNEINNNKKEVGPLINLMVREFPGFASDMFLKRASLFFLQLGRKFEWFKETIGDLHIPADYQVPKMLKYFGVLEYSEMLSTQIQTYSLIPAGSLMECEIRAATVVVSRKLAESTGWITPEVDTWFWTKRKECDDPFHLTITTDY